MATAVVCLVSVLGSTLAPGIAGATGSGQATTTTSAPGSPSASQSQINTTEAQVATIEAQITQEQNALDEDDEQYNQAVVNLSTTRTSLQSTTVTIGAVRDKVALERADLQKDAVSDYVDDTSSASVAQLFAPPSSQSQTRGLYQNIGASQVLSAAQIEHQ
jgi:hypothetical protein